jgi:cytochrome c553
VAPGQLEKAELAFGPGATGNHEVVVSLLSKEGRVISESKLLINIRSGIEATPKHWSALVGKSESAPPPSAAAPPAAKAPSGPVVAQAAKQPPPKSAGPPKSEAQLVTYAKHLVRECTTCHSLYGQDVGIPVMIGLTRDRFLDTMRLYRSGKRDNQAMQVVSQSLDDEQTLALALYLGRIKPPPQPASASAAAAAEKAVAVPTRRAGTPGNVDRIDRWLRRGQQLLDGGDIAQARLLFERAAEFGSGRAMILLAASYDPNVLPWRPGMGLEAEPLKARRIYLEAKKLGMVAEADQRLADLPER